MEKILKKIAKVMVVFTGSMDFKDSKDSMDKDSILDGDKKESKEKKI